MNRPQLSDSVSSNRTFRDHRVKLNEIICRTHQFHCITMFDSSTIFANGCRCRIMLVRMFRTSSMQQVQRIQFTESHNNNPQNHKTAHNQSNSIYQQTCQHNTHEKHSSCTEPIHYAMVLKSSYILKSRRVCFTRQEKHRSSTHSELRRWRWLRIWR